MSDDLGRVLARTILLPLLSITLLAGCSDGKGTDVDCDLQQCAVTFQRGVSASASVFGMEVELVEVKDSLVTVTIGGNEITLPVSGDGQGLHVRELTEEQVVVVFPHNIAS